MCQKRLVKNNSELKYLKLGSKKERSGYTFLFGFFVFMGLAVIFSVRLDEKTYLPLDGALLSLVLTLLCSIPLYFRDNIAIYLSKKLRLYRLYQINQFLATLLRNFLILSLVIIIAIILPSTLIFHLPLKLFDNLIKYMTAFLILFFVLTSYFDILNGKGKIKALFEETYSNLNNFYKYPELLKRTFKKVENFLGIFSIKISSEDLYYGINIKRIKNEDIHKILKNLENALLNIDANPNPSLYDCLKEILENEEKISQVQKISLRMTLARSFDKILRIIVIVAYLIYVAFSIIQGHPIPVPTFT